MTALKIKRRGPMMFDPDARLTCNQLFGLEPIAIVCVNLKGHSHLLHIQSVKVTDAALTAFLTEISEGGGVNRLVQLIATAVDYIGGYRKGPKHVMKRANDYLPWLLAGLVRDAGTPYALIEVGKVNPATDHAPINFVPSDARTGDEYLAWLTARGKSQASAATAPWTQAH